MRTLLLPACLGQPDEQTHNSPQSQEYHTEIAGDLDLSARSVDKKAEKTVVWEVYPDFINLINLELTPLLLVRHLCSFFVLCFHIAHGAVPGPCKHSVTKDHLLNLRRLIGNQLQNSCSSYTFIEHQSLSEVCYVKAAFPHILDLLSKHFIYGRDSDNYRYIASLKNLIFNIYSQKCIPPINEEIEDNPATFAQPYVTSPRAGLEKIEEVIQIYKNLLTENDRPIDWNCEDEYAEYTAAHLAKTSAIPECHCSCTNSVYTPLMAIKKTRSASTLPTSRSSPASALIHQNEAPKAHESVASYEALDSTLSPLASNPSPSAKLHTDSKLFGEHYGSTHDNFLNFVFTTTSDLTDESFARTKGTPSSDTLSPITPFMEIPRKPQRTASVLQFPAQRSDRRSTLAVAKRSLDAQIKGRLPEFYSELLQSWTASTTSNPSKILKKDYSGLEVVPGELGEQFRTPHFDKNRALPSTEDASNNIIPAPKSPVDVVSLQERVTKSSTEATDRHASSNQKNPDERKGLMSSGHGERHSGKSFHKRDKRVLHNATDIMLIITSACIVLLLITVLLFCKQQRSNNR